MFISDLARNAKALDMDLILRESVEENKEYIVDLNTAQLSKGKDSKNETLDPTLRSASYAEAKIAKGGQAPMGIADLKDTGDFWSAFIATPDKEGLSITSTDSKTGKLKAIYGEDIFGLTSESLKDLKSVLLPTVLTKLRHDLQRT